LARESIRSSPRARIAMKLMRSSCATVTTIVFALFACLVHHSSAFHGAAASGGRRSGASFRATASRLEPSSASGLANSTSGAVTLPVSLAIVADQCKCKFVGLCTCEAAVAFMECVADSCASGQCDCQAADYLTSCNAMAQTCSKVGMHCTQEKTTCRASSEPIRETIDELQQELAVLKVRKCKLEEADKAGYINAGVRLQELGPEIQGRLDLLKAKGGPPFYMGCETMPEGSSVSWLGGEAVPSASVSQTPPKEEPASKAPPTTTAAPGSTTTPEAPTPVVKEGPTAPFAETQAIHGWKRFGVMCSNILVYFLFVLLAAVLYDRVRLKTAFPQGPAVDSDDPQGGFSYSLFGCFQDWRLLLLSCFCFVPRWADTMDKANDQGTLVGYWPGVALLMTCTALGLFVGLAAMYPFLSLVSGCLCLVVQVTFRQKLRRRYSIDAGSLKTIAQDFGTWLCCCCCATVQEARQVEAGR